MLAVFTPIVIDLGIPSGTRVIDISTTKDGALFLLSNGTILGLGNRNNSYTNTLGANFEGQLGLPLNGYNKTPRQSLVDDNTPAVAITTSSPVYQHSIMLGSDNNVYFTGKFSGRQIIGDSTNTSRPCFYNSGSNVGQFVRVNFSSSVMAGKTIVAIAVEFYTALVLSNEGNVYGWGYSGTLFVMINTLIGELLAGAFPSGVPVAIDLQGEFITAISMTLSASQTMTTAVALTSSGKVYTWGTNGTLAELGTGSTSVITPAQISSNEVFKSISVRGNMQYYLRSITTPTPTTTSPTTTDTPTPTPTDTPTTSTSTPTTTALPSTTTDAPTTTTDTPTPTQTETPTASITPTTPAPTTTSPTSTASPTTNAPTSTIVPSTSTNGVTTSTNTPTTTSSFTTTAHPGTSCHGISASSSNVCSGAGVCIGQDECQCHSPKTLGRKCEIDMQTSSASYVVFDTVTGASRVNMDAVNYIPGNTGNASIQLVSDHIELTNSFGQSEAGRKGVCLNPSYLIGGVQTFVAFEIPKLLPIGTAVEIWLNDATGKYAVHSSVKNVNGNMKFSVDIGTDSSSDSIVLSTNTYYVLLVSVDNSGAFATAQVVNLKNDPISTVEVYVSDSDTSSALSSAPFFICMSLASSTGRRQQANKDVAVNVKYYGTQKVGTAGTLQLKSAAVGITAGGIAGAVIGSIIGCLLLVCITSVIILLVRYIMRKKVPVNKEKELEDLESPTITTHELVPQPVEAQQEIYQIPEQPVVVEIPEETPLIVEPAPVEEKPIEPEEILIEEPETTQAEVVPELEPEIEEPVEPVSEAVPKPEPVVPLEQEPQEEIVPEQENSFEAEIEEIVVSEQPIDTPLEPETEVEPEPIETVTLGIEADLTLDEEGKKVLGEMKDIITEIRGKVSKITNKNISELQAYATPPPVVFSVLRAALIVLGYDADDLSKWGTCKKSLKDGLLKKVTQFDPTDATHASKKFKLAQEEISELDYETCLKKGSLPTAILCEWVRGALRIRSMSVQLRNKQ
jgi:hypothetical protein